MKLFSRFAVFAVLAVRLHGFAQGLSPSITFGSATIPVGGSTTLTTLINNLSVLTFTNVAFTNTLPAGLAVATPNGLTGTCGGGTITATAGSGSVSLSGATLAPTTSCTFSVNVTGVATGPQSDTTGGFTADQQPTGPTATNSITVTPAIPGAPAPSSWLLLTLGLLAIFGWKRFIAARR